MKKKQLVWIFIFVLSFSGMQPLQKTRAESSTIKINSNQTNVREGPGLSYQKIGQVNQGDTFSALKINGDWIQIQLTNKKGWVANWLVTYEQKKTPTSSSQPQKGASIAINTDGVRVRSGPGTGYKVIGSLNKGKTAELTDIEGDWFKIAYNSDSGWVNSQFADPIGQPHNQGKTSQQNKSNSKNKDTTATVTASTLSVRSQGSLDGKIIGKVSKGDKFPVLEEVNNWIKIEYKSGSYGWVAGWYLEKSATSTSSDSELKGSLIEILYNGTNIRKKPSVQSDVIKRANQGDTFETIKLTNDWYEIRLQNKEIAYVAGWVVKTQGSIQQVEKPGAATHLKNKTIVVDPGHGGRDTGTSGFRGTSEKDITIQTALLLSNKLKAAGAKVILTRLNDTYISLNSRVRTSQYHSADAFISIHYDSISERSVRGTTSFYYHSYQKSLASTLHSAIVQYTNLKDRGVRYGDYHVLRENKRNAVLVELGYLSNPTEETIITSSQFQEQAASGIFQGLASYFKK